MAAQNFNSLELKVIRQILGPCYDFTSRGNICFSASSIGDYRRNSYAYYFHKQPNGEIYIRRQIEGGYAPYGWGNRNQKYIYVIHRESVSNDYRGFKDVMDAANWLKGYLRRHC